jgi:hypothetical protein
MATHPIKLNLTTIKRTLSRALQAQNIRQHPLDKENNQRRYEFKTAHGFRKYFKSNAERVMRPLNIEILMDHKTGVSDSYYKPTEHELLEDYLKAVDYLTINKDQKIATQLQKQFVEHATKEREQNEAMRKELEELKARDREIQEEIMNIVKADKVEDYLQQQIAEMQQEILKIKKEKKEGKKKI